MIHPSVMSHKFGEVPRVDIPRSTFDRSHGHKTTFDADKLIPILIDDIIPGDTFSVNTSVFARLATPLYPLMDNMYLETFFFFTPYRLLWDNWEKFCGAQDDPTDSIDFTIPITDSFAPTTGSLANYMGLPIGTAITVSALPFRAYQLIANEWFRNQNLRNSHDMVTDDGPDTSSDTNRSLRTREKRPDYFTSCLPWPQKGTAVSLPLGTTAPIAGQPGADTRGVDIQELGTTSFHYSLATAAANATYARQSGAAVALDTMVADLSGATAATINDLRLAFQTQRLLERDARSGTRYPETILAHYGVTVPDFRVQRPEFLGGGISRVNVTPVAQTTYQGTPTAEDTKGSLAAFGTVSGNHSFTFSAVEHGVLIGMASVRGDITYHQGVERYWDKSTRYDFYYPVLSQIGEQAVTIRELYVGAADPTLVFGYQERYAEYRYKPSRVTGLMDPNAASTLAAWHLSEDFASEPTLGADFIKQNTTVPLDRGIAVSTEPHFIADFYFDMKCARPMPLYGVPGNLDHF